MTSQKTGQRRLVNDLSVTQRCLGSLLRNCHQCFIIGGFVRYGLLCKSQKLVFTFIFLFLVTPFYFPTKNYDCKKGLLLANSVGGSLRCIFLTKGFPKVLPFYF